MSDTSDWEELTDEQQADVDAWRKQVGEYLCAQTDAFYKQHPELRLTWSFVADALIRAKHPVSWEPL